LKFKIRQDAGIRHIDLTFNSHTGYIVTLSLGH